MEILELLELVNTKLATGASLVAIAKEIGVNESTIRKKLNKNGYKREGNKFVPNKCITSNITVSKVKEENIREVQKIDYNKLNLLLENLDTLLKLIPNHDATSNITDIKSGINDVISLRCDTGLYKAIKARAKRDDVNIADIVNKALIDYLNNYI